MTSEPTLPVSIPNPHPVEAASLSLLYIRTTKGLNYIYELREKDIKIGSSNDNDLILDDDGISRLHASLKRDANGNYIIRDENSTNLTKLNEQTLVPERDYQLQSGNQIKLGPIRLVFTSQKNIPSPGSSIGLSLLYVRSNKEPYHAYELHKDVISIGRSDTDDIYLTNTSVSRGHATLSLSDNGVYKLRDQESANGTSHNGQILKKDQDYSLKSGDQIRVGETELIFVKL
jgi:pSer/pThr/pTyr-binding forkhead associated (FHA) protein